MTPVTITDIHYHYRSGEKIFDGLSHTFMPSAATGISGDSGRGKSTLLYLIGLMLTPSAGSI